jgi:hypothetical protein
VIAQTLRRNRRQLEEAHELSRKLATLEIDLRPFRQVTTGEDYGLQGSPGWAETSPQMPQMSKDLNADCLGLVRRRVSGITDEVAAVKAALATGTEIASVAASIRIQRGLNWLTAILVVLTILSVVLGFEAPYYGVHHAPWRP